jgi:hypothetical protein
MTRTSNDRSLHRDQRGAAMAEALIVVLFFTFVFACMMFMHRLYEDRIDVARRTRACAWAYTNHGCNPEAEEVRRVCAGATFENGLQPDGLLDWAESEAGDLVEGLDEASGFAAKVLDELGIVGDSTTVSVRSEAVRPPSPLGTRETTVLARYPLLCNERKRTPLQIAGEAFCRVVNDLTDKVPGC